jgi:hypothetical protein
MSMWKRLKEYINKTKIGDVITRKDLLNYLYYGSKPKSSNYGTGGDNYRRCLEKLGILEKCGRGRYKILYHIKENVSSEKIKQLSYKYDNTYRQWFNDIKVED